MKIVHLNFRFYQYSERLDDFLISFISGLPKEVSEKKEEHHNPTCHAMSRFRELAFSPSFYSSPTHSDARLDREQSLIFLLRQ